MKTTCHSFSDSDKSVFTFCLASIFLAQLLCAHLVLTSAFSQALLTYFWRALRNNHKLLAFPFKNVYTQTE